MPKLTDHLKTDDVASIVATGGYSQRVAKQAVIHAARILGLRVFGPWLHIPTNCNEWLLAESKAAAEMLTAQERRRARM